MSTFRLIRPALFALLLQGAMVGLIFMTGELAAGTSPRMGEVGAHYGLLASSALGGLVAGAIALRGLFRVHVYRKPLAATLLTLFPYLPVVAISSIATWMFFVFSRIW